MTKFLRRIIPYVLYACLLLSCKKDQTTQLPYDAKNQNYYIEDFRKPGMDDYQTIKAACDSLPENSNVFFARRTYTFSHTIMVQKSLNFFGPATLQREDQIKYTLKEPASEFSKMIILNNATGIISSERFFITLGQSYKRNTALNVVNSVSGDTLFLNDFLGKTIDTRDGIYPSGTSLFKNINFFWIISAVRYPDQSCGFNNLIFDGNRDNNTGSYSWQLNTAVMALTKGTTKYTNCNFINSPGETIVGHNADIRNCTFYNLNGSGFHTSADKVNCSENEIHSYLVGNLFENTNQISTDITGHSEGAITIAIRVATIVLWKILSKM